MQFGAVPEKIILATGRTTPFDEVVDKLTAVQSKVLSISVIVNAIAPVAVSSAVVRFAIVEITGTSFTAVTVKLYELVDDNKPSVTVNTTFEIPF